MRSKRLTFATIAVAVLVLCSLPASATSLIYDLNVGDSSLPALTGSMTSYGTVTLDLSNDGKSITITISAASGVTLVGAPGFSVFGFNYIGGPGQLAFSGLPAGFTVGPGSMGEMGAFQYALTPNAYWNGTVLTFTVSALNGSTLGLGDLYVTNGSNGNQIATRVAVPGFNGVATSLQTPTVTPEPATMALLGSGMLVAGGIWRRRRNKN